MDDHQAAYATQRRDMMVKRVDEELHLAENKKRAQDTADEYAETYKRAKLSQVDPTATGFQHGIACLSPCTWARLMSEKLRGALCPARRRLRYWRQRKVLTSR